MRESLSAKELFNQSSYLSIHLSIYLIKSTFIYIYIYIYILKLLGLKVIIKFNLKRTNFLVVTLNLEKGTIETFKKENDSPIHLHTSFNHPASIIR